MECSNTNKMSVSTDNIFNKVILSLLSGESLSIREAIEYTQTVTSLLRAEPNLLRINNSQITIVGDVHGQLKSLAKIFAIDDSLEEPQWLFLGNYTGGCGYNCECLLLLIAAKLAFPRRVFLLRGNNESKVVSQVYDLKSECSQKYSIELYDCFIKFFNALSLAALVDRKYLCVHGGLSPLISRIDDINVICRFRDIPSKGPLCDLLWSDPHWDCENPLDSNSLCESGQDVHYYTPMNQHYDTNMTFTTNEQRACGYIFNYACLKYFLSANKLLCLIRSHEVQDKGYQLYRTSPTNSFPCMVTIFSAPNYDGVSDNKGALLKISKGELIIWQFY